MIKIALGRFKASTVLPIFFIGLAWVICSRFFNSGTSEALYSEQKYHEDVSRIYYDLARFSEQRGDLKKATYFLKHAIDIDASFLKPYEALEKIYNLRNKPLKAQMIHKKAHTASLNKTIDSQNKITLL